MLSILVLLCFLVTSISGQSPVYAQLASPSGGEFRLPAPGVRVGLSLEFNPPILKGIKVHQDNPFRFDFILDVGDGSKPSLRDESTRLIKYFLASLTIPEQDLWVNLSPYEKDRIIPQSFGLTEMGRDLLAEDYILKQITASLIYPEGETGKKFGTTNIPVNTFNKVWIVPDKAVVYENAKAGTAYVVESKLKVMLEQDYLALEKNRCQPGDANQGTWLQPCPRAGCQATQRLNVKAPQGKHLNALQDTSELGSQIVREVVIPELTKEVNEGKNFSQLRQVYITASSWPPGTKRKSKTASWRRCLKTGKKYLEWGMTTPSSQRKILSS